MESADTSIEGIKIVSAFPACHIIGVSKQKRYVGSATVVVFDAASCVGPFDVTLSADVSIAWNNLSRVVLISTELGACRSKWIFPARRCSTSALADMRWGYLNMFRYRTEIALMR
jgi:hypothetical protein